MDNTWAEQEMQGATIPDRRRRRSLARMCGNLAERAGESFSAACGSAGRQAAHRIFAHPDTSVDQLLHGHYQQTAHRAQAYPLVLVAQDTTAVEFNGRHRVVGLGPVSDSGSSRGFFSHSALALTPDGLPLGLLHVQMWAREAAERGSAKARRTRLPEEKESAKWRLGLEGVEAALPAGQRVLLIQDRESDVFDFLAAARRPQTYLLVRASQARVVWVPSPTPESSASAAPAWERTTLFDYAAGTPRRGVLKVSVAAKPPQRSQPARAAREALLEVRAGKLEIQPPRRPGMPAEPQSFWVIQAREVDPPAGQEPIEWVLLSDYPGAPEPEPSAEEAGEAGEAPAEGAADGWAVTLVRYYARRWGIERLHYTLKSGVGAERLQFDDAASLMHAVSVLYVVAWRLLYLTHVARVAPETPAAALLTADEVAVLTHKEGQPVTTAHGAIRAIAKLGGFEAYPSAGEPGVKSLWLGLRRLEAMADGWRLAWQAIRASNQESW